MKSFCAVLGLALLIVSNAVAQVAADVNGDIILGRPTDTSISVSVMTHLDRYVYVEYGDQRGEFWARTAAMELAAEDPHVFELTGLDPDTEYFYRLRFKQPEADVFQASSDYVYLRNVLSRAASTTPLFLVPGNHDTERQTRLDGAPDNLSVWADNARKTLCSTGTTICT